MLVPTFRSTHPEPIGMGRKPPPEPLPDSGRRTRGLTAQSDPVSIALKRLHADVTSEDLPDDFLSILAAIDRKIETGEDNQ